MQPGNPANRDHSFSAVEEFALKHDTCQLPAGQKRYQELIPKTTPGPGQQYAFEVNLDQCSGCKACVIACHHENGLEVEETWRSVGLIHGGTTQDPVIQHVTTACHHCLDPACLNGCPVNAYEKDKTTGVVKHLDDQCIGCQYCTFTCAYDVPQYSKKKGIVHKCDMCISRLNAADAPACVRACPSQAIRITLVDTAAVRRDPEQYVRIPDAPDSGYTLPTTRYLTQRTLPSNMASADFFLVKPEHAHTPLIVMLVLTQLSVGAFSAVVCLQYFLEDAVKIFLFPCQTFVALGVGFLALGASIFHLGRPWYAFRAVLGLRRSWLSREILVFGVFASLATLYALSWNWALLQRWRVNVFTENAWLQNPGDILALLTMLTGLLGVFCSVKVYQVTRRPFWDTPLTAGKFFLTTAVLGLSGIWLVAALVSFFSSEPSLKILVSEQGSAFCWALMALMAAKLLLEAAIFRHLRSLELTALKKTALLMKGPFKKKMLWRFVLGTAGGFFLPAVFLFLSPGPAEALFLFGSIFVLATAGELLERYLFFRAVVPLKMPGAKIL